MEINNRIDMIMHHPLFVEAMKIIEEAEEHRIYCKHGFDHCLDVARICYIMSKEACCTLEKDVIYAAAFLHDIGRSKEYTEGTSHEEAGVGLARQILADSYFSEDETEEICTAILYHKRANSHTDAKMLEKLLQKADKYSRKCFSCDAIDSCYWPEQMKNKTVIL